jgi:hypothetical protein
MTTLAKTDLAGRVRQRIAALAEAREIGILEEGK